MATYLLDTNIIIDILNGKRGRREAVVQLLSEGHILACCPINISEIYAGMRADEEKATEAFLRSLDWHHFSWEAARLAGSLKREYRREGVTLSLGDTAIAAIAITNGLALITDNVKDFPMKELMLYQLPAA